MSANMWRVEFHCHTHYSLDSLIQPAALLAACEQRGIDRVVVTDHNTIQGALAAQTLDPQRVIIGEEIKTSKGELLAAFVKEKIPKGLSPQETISRLRTQGAFISVSHPFDQLRSGHWDLPDLNAISPYVDAIETFNARCFPSRYNDYAKRYAGEHQILGTVGSDAHSLLEIGRAVLVMPPFEDAESFKRSFAHAHTEERSSSPFIRILSRYAVMVNSFRNPV